MRFRHTPSIAKVAESWIDSPVTSRDRSDVGRFGFLDTPSGRVAAMHLSYRERADETMDLSMKTFLKFEGDKRVNSPITGKQIKLKSLTSGEYRDDEKSQELLRKEYKDWKDQKRKDKDKGEPETEADPADKTSPEDETPRIPPPTQQKPTKGETPTKAPEKIPPGSYQGPKGQGTGTKEQLKRLQDDLVDYATQDGVLEDVAREMVSGLSIGDTEDDVRQVERNLEQKMKESVDKRQKEDAAAREQVDAGQDRGRAMADAESKAKADAESKAKADAAAKAKAEAGEKKRRDDIRKNVVDMGAAVDKAKADLEAAKKAEYDRPGERDVAVAEAEQNLKDLKREYKDAVRAHRELTDQEARETDQKLGAALDTAKKALDDATAEVDRAEKALDAAKASGNASDMARAAKNLAAAKESKRKAEDGHRDADNSLAMHQFAESERMSKVTQQVVADILSGEGEEPGFVVYDRYGNEQRYNPEPADKVYSYMMGLLGEDAEIHKAEEIDYRRSEYFGDSKGKSKSLGFGGDFDWDFDSFDWDGDLFDLGGRGGKKPKLKPTKSKKPRNPDGSSPPGMDNDEYGPGEFWRTKGGMWAAKSPKDLYDTFVRADEARAFAMPPARTAATRVAYRYIERMVQ